MEANKHTKKNTFQVNSDVDAHFAVGLKKQKKNQTNKQAYLAKRTHARK